ncbi:MAG: pyruvate kinase, partial [Verrucomicrobiae bacterium]|nr:pyruvate kinase [Verrucomicrobiae bacterium]
HRSRQEARELMTRSEAARPCAMSDLISMSVERVLESADAAAVIVPTRSGATARRLARFRLPVWVAAVSPEARACAALRFSYGVTPVLLPEALEAWDVAARKWIQTNELPGDLAVLVQGPSRLRPDRNHTLELIRLSAQSDPEGADGFG